MLTKVCLRAPAKINLYLQVLGRRNDGYHLLASLMQKLALCDTLEIEVTTGTVSLYCPDSDLPRDSENIALRAAHLFFSTYADRLPAGSSARISLYKQIPVAAGLGGGSSDAAAVLVGLDRLYQTEIPRDELAAVSVRLGADVPLFVHDWPVAWATGIGDRLARAAGLDDECVLLVNPGFPVSTKLIYDNLALTLEEKKINLKNSHSNDLLNMENPFLNRSFLPCNVRNDLEEVTVSLFREINDIKRQLLAAGASSALMSGSGPTVFALFAQGGQKQAAACYEQMRKTYEQVFLVQPLHKDWNRFLSLTGNG